MTDARDPLLAALAEIEREHERRHPEAWEAVIAGAADPQAVADERAAVDPADEHAVFKDMFSRPASEAELAALVERAAGALGAASAAPAGPEAARVIALPRRRLLVAAAAALAIAAALVWRATAPAPAPMLGPYSVTVRDTPVQALRSDASDGPVARYRLDSEVDWVLSPEREVAGAVALQVLARAPTGSQELVTPVFTRSPAGALRIRGPLATVLPLAPGRWQLAFVVSGAGNRPEAASQVAQAQADGRALVLPQRIEIEIEAP
jgi:hypothetical protein